MTCLIGRAGCCVITLYRDVEVEVEGPGRGGGRPGLPAPQSDRLISAGPDFGPVHADCAVRTRRPCWQSWSRDSAAVEHLLVRTA